MGKILIVDDSKLIAHVAKTMLTKRGHEVVVAQDGKAGLEAAKSEQPDIILLDLIMPIMSSSVTFSSFCFSDFLSFLNCLMRAEAIFAESCFLFFWCFDSLAFTVTFPLGVLCHACNSACCS